MAAKAAGFDAAARDAALSAGWSETQLLDAFADTARTIFTNYFNHFVDTQQDVPEAPAL